MAIGEPSGECYEKIKLHSNHPVSYTHLDALLKDTVVVKDGITSLFIHELKRLTGHCKIVRCMRIFSG